MAEIVASVNTKELDRLFAELQARGINLRPALVAIQQEIMDDTEETFEQEGRPKWPALSPVTERARAKKGKSGKMLQVSGQLAASIQSGAANKIGPNFVTVGTNVPYAPHLQYGTEQKVTKKQRMWMGMNLGLWPRVGQTITNPPRPFLDIRPEVVKTAEEILADHLAGRL